jgi:serine/threonine protein phosphatase PrpC
VAAVITPSHVICASVGDSRCVVGSTTTGVTTALTEDHKPENIEEKIRIEKAGAFVAQDRVNGELAMSRALGDFRYKRSVELKTHEHPVICYPDVAVHKRSGRKDEVLVLACDGVFDVMTNAEVRARVISSRSCTVCSWVVHSVTRDCSMCSSIGAALLCFLSP